MPQALITGLPPSRRSTELSAVFGSWLALMGRSSLVQGEGRSRRYVASGRPIHRMGKCRYELRHRDIETSIHKLSYSFPISPGGISVGDSGPASVWRRGKSDDRLQIRADVVHP